MNNDSKKYFKLGSDQPLVDPKEDTFGYAKFSSLLSNAIIQNKNPQGLVLAIHGKWGSGKSSVLNFIKHDLNQLPNVQKPIIIEFNPWWFDGREQIASQLLDQFSSQLPDQLRNIRKIANLLGKYSKQIADTTADVTGFSWLKRPLEFLFNSLPGLKAISVKNDVPSIKNKIATALKESGKRFVFFIDDIDRLTPNEAQDLFRAIKALADFPEVVYVLFFDRREVANALTSSLKMDGEAYLEKIVQAPFHLPAVNKELLYHKLFQELDLIIESNSQPIPFDTDRWGDILFNGLDKFIKKPRDIVRILNSISVTYPPLVGEVNPVDFIALEILRVFEPSTYEHIRDNKELFSGAPLNINEEKIYFEKWKKSLKDVSREYVINVVGRLFPRSSLNFSVSSASQSEWRSELRPCNPELFDVYFQFGVPPGNVSQLELDQIVSAQTSADMASHLIKAKNISLPNGRSKIEYIIERLQDFDQLPAEQASKLAEALIDNGHLLLLSDSEDSGILRMHSRRDVSRIISQQLERLTVDNRQNFLYRVGQNSPGLFFLVDLVDDALQAKSDSSKAPDSLRDLEHEFVENLRNLIISRLENTKANDFMLMPGLDFIVSRWSQWGDPARIRECFSTFVNDDNGLIALIEKFLRTGRKYSSRKTTVTYNLSMKSLSAVIDVDAMKPRIYKIQARPNLTKQQTIAAKRFLQGLQAISKGKDPDVISYDD